jgi:oleandomycin transport system ATP-binding protein
MNAEHATYAIEARGLAKRFGKTTALAGVDLTARAGTVLGLLGPNGAGKATTMRVILGLDDPRPACLAPPPSSHAFT